MTNPPRQPFIRRLLNKGRVLHMRRRVVRADFTIISNNCWGAGIYTDCDLAYATPFVGLFIFPDCYVRLLQDFRRIVSSPLRFKPRSKYDEINAMRESFHRFPVGVVGDDIEIHFQHYSSTEEAQDKWARRVKRIHPDDDGLYAKFCDHGGATLGHLKSFESVPIPHRVCFVSRRHSQCPSAVLIPGYETAGQVPDGLTLYHECHRHFDVAGWINAEAAPHWSFKASRHLL